MNIKSINYVTPNYNFKKESGIVKEKYATDVFQKTSPSFGASKFEDFCNSNDDDIFDIESLINECGDFFKKFEAERRLEILINNLRKSGKGLLKKPIPVSKYLDALYCDNHDNKNKNYLEDILSGAEINNSNNLYNYIRIFDSNPDNRIIFKEQGIEAIQIYSCLKDKSNLGKNSEMLLYIYNTEAEQEHPDFDKLNYYPDSIKKYNNTNDLNNFKTKFNHQKDNFNNFEDISDVLDLIDYLNDTYEDKLKLIEKSKTPLLNNYTPERLYNKIPDIIDYYYENEEEAANEELAKDIQNALDYTKLEKTVFKQVPEIDNTQKKLEFMSLINNSGFTIKEINSLSKAHSIMPDIDFITKLNLAEPIISEIEDLTGKNKNDSKALYMKFSDVFVSCYQSDSDIDVPLEKMLKTIEKYNFKSSDSVLNLYNKIYGTKNKILTSKQLQNFNEILKYNNSLKFLDEAKNKKVLPKVLLEKSKTEFESVKDDIENFIENDETSYFAGKTPLEIYQDYEELILEKPDCVSNTLLNIVNFDINNSKNNKIKTIKALEEYIPERKDIVSFITNNHIKMDNTPEGKKYTDLCLDVLNSVYDPNDKESSSKRINYFINSDFIYKSRLYLNKFLEQTQPKQKTEILSLIADKKIDSFLQLDDFLQKYKNHNGLTGNIISHIKSTPENITFKDYVETIYSVQNQILQSNLPISINNDNISCIDINKFNNCKNTAGESDYNKLYADLLNAGENENFIYAISKNSKTIPYKPSTNFKIAREIAIKSEEYEQSYKNIIDLLNLDKSSLGLDENCNQSMYTKAIENKLPQEFVNFINSDDWITANNDSEGNPQKLPVVPLHARMRAIDRFALKNANKIQDLYTEATKQNMQNLFKTIYSDTPIKTEDTYGHRFMSEFKYENDDIKTIFDKNGTIITLFEKPKMSNMKFIR